MYEMVVACHYAGIYQKLRQPGAIPPAEWLACQAVVQSLTSPLHLGREPIEGLRSESKLKKDDS